jgi:pilus assembly protein CpaB
MFKKIKFRSLLDNSWILLIAAVLVAGGLTFLLYKYLTDREAKLKAELAAQRRRDGIEVVVPNRDVPIGTPLASGDFVVREIAPDLVYDDMIRASDFDSHRASRLVKAVRRGLPLRASDIDALRGRDFSDMLPPGQRAVTLEIDVVNSTASMVRPGNRVDLYWVGRVPAKQSASSREISDDSKTAQLLLSNVLILATGQDVRPRDAGEAMASANRPPVKSPYDTVTVQIPVSESARVALAQKVGSLRLILRNVDDKGTDVPKAISETTLFSKAFKSDSVVEVISGGSGGSTTIPSGSRDTSSTAPASTYPTLPSSPSSHDIATPGQPSSYDTANAIAQQLQKLDTRATPGSN